MRRILWLLVALALALPAAAKDRDKGKDKPGADKPARAQAPVIGDKAPAFTLEAFPGGKVSLKDYRGHWLVLAFYPKAAAPKDIAQMASLKGAWDDIKALDATILGVSMDPPNVVERFQKEQALPFALASDAGKDASTAYGTLGIGGLFSVRRAFIINPQGQIADTVSRCPENKYGEQVAQKLKALQADAAR